MQTTTASPVARYRRTPARRLINVLARAAIRAGIGPSHRYLLSVAGRRTGVIHRTPVGVVLDGPDRWLVAPYGEVDWVRNAWAGGTVRLSRAGRTTTFRVERSDPSERGRVLRRYLDLEPITRPFFRARPGDPAEDFALEADRHPVLRLSAI